MESRTERRRMGEEFESTRQARMLVEAYIESHPGKLSPKEICTKLGVSDWVFNKVVESHPLVRIIDESLKNRPGPQKRYFSVAVLPIPTPAGIREETDITRRYSDEIGRDAREDYYELIRIRSLCLHQGKRRHKI